jgi:hypothetical protein
MTFARVLLATALVALPAIASAQEQVYRFRLAGAPNNITGCIALDSSFTRVHTLTLGDGKAELKSAGGINDTMKQVQPGIYRTTYSLSGQRFDIEASVPAKSLIVSNRDTGCKWSAQAD